MLATIGRRYGQAERIWVMDRGIPTEEILEELRTADSHVRCLVGTPKGRLTRMESALADKPWQQVRPEMRVKLLPSEGEVYVLAESEACASVVSRRTGSAWANCALRSRRRSDTRPKNSRCSPDLLKIQTMDQRLTSLTPPGSGSRASIHICLSDGPHRGVRLLQGIWGIFSPFLGKSEIFFAPPIRPGSSEPPAKGRNCFRTGAGTRISPH